MTRPKESDSRPFMDYCGAGALVAGAGGFGSGVLLGLGLALSRDRLRPAIDHVALGIFGVLIVATWALALS